MTTPDELEVFGLARDEALAWSTLAREGALSAPEIAARGGFGRSRAYEILRGLEERGLVEVLLGETRRYRAVPLDRHARGVLADAREAERAAHVRLERVDALFKNPERAGAGGLAAVRILEGRRAAHDALARLFKAAKDRATLVATGRAALRFLDSPEGAEAYEAARAAGVRTRFVLFAGEDPEAANRAAEILGADASRAVAGHSLAIRATADEGRVVLVIPERDDERVYFGRDFVFEADSSVLAADVLALAERWARPSTGTPRPAAGAIGDLLSQAIAGARAEVFVLDGAGRSPFSVGPAEALALEAARARGVRVRIAASTVFDGTILVVDGARVVEWHRDGSDGPGVAFAADDAPRAKLFGTLRPD